MSEHASAEHRCMMLLWRIRLLREWACEMGLESTVEVYRKREERVRRLLARVTGEPTERESR